MKIHKAYRFQLRTDAGIEKKLAQYVGCCRFVYNRGLELQKQRFESGSKRLNYSGLCKELTQWRHDGETAFLKEAPSQALQQSLKDLERAYQNFFSGRTGLPRFKKRGRQDSFRFPEPKQFRVDERNCRIFLPKLGWLRYRKSRSLKGRLLQVTVSRSVGKWYLSIQTEQDSEIDTREREGAVGLDLGVVNFATLSDGTKIEPVNCYRRKQKKLAREQRRLARKQKYGANWKKQASRVRVLHKKIADSRRDFLHKTSTGICKKHAMLVIEDLNVKGMSSSASGSRENPGRNVKAKAGLNKAILDQGWSEFRRQLEYKMEWSGGTLITVPARNTSLSCFGCGHVSRENRIDQARFKCTACGQSENADLNAARNILAAGLAVIACGEISVGNLREAGTHRRSA